MKPPVPDAAGSTAPTRILDWRHPRVAELIRSVAAVPPPGSTSSPDSTGLARRSDQLAALRRAHGRIAATVRPVYSVHDERPVSEVLRRGRGSCSQRLAVLEAVARASGVPTRVRGLRVAGAFWHPRFPHLRRLVPEQVLLAWPEFRFEEPAHGGAGTSPWLPVSELFGPLVELSGRRTGGFTNEGAETLFEALSRTAVDWDGATACAADADTDADSCGCDLSTHVLADLGHFDSRDDLFARHGQTLCGPARWVAEPVLGRRSAGARLPAPPLTPAG
ncbi:transglutaminase domain-containing protein [Streptomyces sp. NPDC057302]|uniref:transglutaminase domain-containing protein n=1 Tax=Streptomyces sp. NPDC057302 TaxID=3346094 RepID=UPI00363F66A3